MSTDVAGNDAAWMEYAKAVHEFAFGPDAKFGLFPTEIKEDGALMISAGCWWHAEFDDEMNGKQYPCEDITTEILNFIRSHVNQHREITEGDHRRFSTFVRRISDELKRFDVIPDDKYLERREV